MNATNLHLHSGWPQLSPLSSHQSLVPHSQSHLIPFILLLLALLLNFLTPPPPPVHPVLYPGPAQVSPLPALPSLFPSLPLHAVYILCSLNLAATGTPSSAMLATRPRMASALLAEKSPTPHHLLATLVKTDTSSPESPPPPHSVSTARLRSWP